MKEKLHFYYTNDLHSHFANWPKIMTHFNQKRMECEQKNESYWLFDIGDHMDRVHPITEATMGKANVTLLNEAGYDFATLGNNEGITLSHDDLYDLYEDAKFDVVCSNLENQESVNPNWLKRARIVKSAQGTRIGVIGLTARFNTYYNLLGWHTTAISETIQAQLKDLEGETDIIVLMSHLGIYEDEKIAREFPKIDLIMGGHTHHLLRIGQEVHHTLLTAAGKHCHFVGEVEMMYDHDAAAIVSKEAYATDITELPEDRATARLLEKLYVQADAILEKEIIYTEDTIPVDWYKAVPIMEALTEKVREKTNADCGMLNAGLLVEGFSKGSITYKDVHQACPHPINPCVVGLTGEELTKVVCASMAQAFMDIELKGFGFRGKVIGKMVFANLTVKMDVHTYGEPYVREILFNHQPLGKETVYKVATADMFTFGRLLPEVARSSEKHLFLPELLRDILVETLEDYSA